MVTLVPQDPWLHSGTIAENISYGGLGVTCGQILAAADSSVRLERDRITSAPRSAFRPTDATARYAVPAAQ